MTQIVRVQMYLAGKSPADAVLGSHLSCFGKSLAAIPVKHCYIVDGGLAAALKNNTLHAAQHVWFVGDGDSASNDDILQLEKIEKLKRVALQTEKDVSDFGAALDVLKTEALESTLIVEVFGSLGGRSDHELINLFEIERFVVERHAPTIFLCEPSVLIANTSFEIIGLQGKTFSILKAQHPLNIFGAKYSGKISFQRPSHGLSNQVVREVLAIETTKLGCFWVYL